MEDKDLRDEGSTTGSDVKAAPFFRKSLLDGAITVAGVVTKDSMKSMHLYSIQHSRP